MIRHLLAKMLEMIGDLHLTYLVRNVLEKRRFVVALDDKKSQWRRQRNGLPREVYWRQ